jgi:mannosyl-3-phosphoglycerate phosphatase family protein
MVSFEDMEQFIFFTDLDGTLLDYHTYSFDAARPALALLADRRIPVVICSSKTRAEIEYYREKMDNHHPFISENGGGIFIPRSYFTFAIQGEDCTVHDEGDYIVMRLGAHYGQLREAIALLREDGFQIRGFGDMTSEEIAALTGLGFAEAGMAKMRDFDEPFIFTGSAGEEKKFMEAIREKGFNYTRGRFFHLLGNSDKGKAVCLLTALFKREMGDLTTVALGDNPNDLPMLKQVDIPVIVQEHDGSYAPGIDLPGFLKAEGIGPKGWNRIVARLLSENLPPPS